MAVTDIRIVKLARSTAICLLHVASELRGAEKSSNPHEPSLTHLIHDFRESPPCPDGPSASASVSSETEANLAPRRGRRVWSPDQRRVRIGRRDSIFRPWTKVPIATPEASEARMKIAGLLPHLFCLSIGDDNRRDKGLRHMSISEHKHMSELDSAAARRIEVFTGAGRRRT